MKITFGFCLILSLLLSTACLTIHEINLVYATPKIHMPTDGRDVTYFNYYAMNREFIRYFESRKITGKDSVRTILHLLKQKGLYQKLAPEWHPDILKAENANAYIPYFNRDSATITHLYPSSKMNVTYRLIMRENDTLYLGQYRPCCYPQILLYKNQYYIVKGNFYFEMDSLLQAYLGHPFKKYLD
ncbi:MAG: hypothetical protein R3C61_28505 [Bacteroidia bacterium]